MRGISSGVRGMRGRSGDGMAMARVRARVSGMMRVIVSRSIRTRWHAINPAEVLPFFPQRIDDISKFDRTKEGERCPSDVNVARA